MLLKSSVIFFFTTILFCNQSFCQSKKVSAHATGGIAFTILDSGLGGSIGMNGIYRLNSYFCLETQLSYNHVRINSSFISGRKGFNSAVNGLGGLRLYFNPNDEYRFYINGMIGGSYEREKLDGLSIDPIFTGGVSLGAYMDFNHKYVFGLALESPNFLILRLGYIF